MFCGMGTDSTDYALSQARTQNRAKYGTETEARAYADDMQWGYCANCYGLFYPRPEYENEGHQCLTNGVDAAYLL